MNTPETSNLTGICRNDRYILAASCRLDNRYELARQLNLAEEQCDHEYLLAAYIAFGQDCTQHLLGDFSFVVWDITEQTLFMAKDHLGIRPLFYYQDEEKFLFATSIHAIKLIIQPVLNEKYIAKELKRYKQDVEDTFFRNIHRLKPAHSATFSLKKAEFVSKRYWELQPIDISAFKTPEALYQELNKRFTEAVACRTRAQKNIGCQLSGGCDSSAIAVLISHTIPKAELHTYAFVLSDKTRGYSKNGIDEQQMQQSVIDYAGLLPENHHKVEDLHFKDVFEQMEKTNLVMGGYANTDCVWQDSMFKMAAENQVGVMMSGFMGDECVSIYGNNYYYDYIGNREIKNLAKFLFKDPISGAKKIASYFRNKQTGRTIKDYEKIIGKYNLLILNTPASYC